MPWWVWLLVALGAAALLITALAFLLRKWFRRLTHESLARRINALPVRAKASLIRRLIRDPRVPWWAKALLPALVLYLAMPFDIIPDFIPVLGYFDDIVVLLVVAFLFRRAVPLSVIEENLEALQAKDAPDSPGEGRGR